MPSISEALSIANQHFDGGRIQAAEQIFRQILQIQPNHVDALHRLGILLAKSERHSEAAETFLEAVAASPDTADFHRQLGSSYLKLQNFDEAVMSCENSLILDPNDSGTHNNLGLALDALGQSEAAILNFRRAVYLNQNDPVGFFNLGNAVGKQGNLNEAASCYQQAIVLKPDYDAAHVQMGIVFQKQLRLDYAVACYQNALLVNPDSFEARYHLGMAWLQLGELASGWPDYESRIKVKRLTEFRVPKWDGTPLTGRRILLYAEQGLGDTIQFIRFAQTVKESGGHVIVACHSRMLGLLKTCSGIDVLVPKPKSTADGLPGFDFYLHLLSVPGIFGTTLETIPHETPYLRADVQLIEQWKPKFESQGELKVGLAWQGNRLNSNDRDRSIPLAEFAPLGRVEGVKYFSLQKGYGSEQVQSNANRLKIVDFTDRMDESSGAFLDTAAAMMNLDLVITSDSSVAHLAGALGVPVWVALSHSPDWRWMLGREDSPWYPTMRLFRQELTGDWAGVFRRIATELRYFNLSDGATERPLIWPHRDQSPA